MARSSRSTKRPPFSPRARGGGSRGARRSLVGSYLERTRTPLAALVFVLPLLILHEIGVQWYATLPERLLEYRIAAFSLMVRFFHTFGASGRYLPALAVVAMLLSWHIARRDPWVFNIPLLPLMVLESLLLAAPLVGVYFLFSARSPTYAPVGEWKIMASLYLGAGVYEELVFRLAAFALLSFVLVDLLRLPTRWATPFMVLIAAATFSAYHMLGFSELPWQAFVFIALRGVYYGIIFLERGFGITVGTHTAYDLLFLSLREVNHH